MSKFQFFFDPAQCLGCKACQIACKDKNNLPLNIFIRYVQEYEAEEMGIPAVTYYSYAKPFQEKLPAGTEGIDYPHLISCNTCPDLRKKGQAPACIAACPTRCLIVQERGGD